MRICYFFKDMTNDCAAICTADFFWLLTDTEINSNWLLKVISDIV